MSQFTIMLIDREDDREVEVSAAGFVVSGDVVVFHSDSSSYMQTAVAMFPVANVRSIIRNDVAGRASEQEAS